MPTNLVREQLTDGLALTATIDGTRPLAELTATVNAVCDGVEGRQDRTVVVLLLDPEPRDSREWPVGVSVSDVNRWERAVRRLEKLSAMNIAVVRGACGGPALDLLLAADFRVGTPDMLLMPPVNDGHFWPGMSLYRLVQHLGVARARQLVLWGDDISAEKASALGLVDQLSDDVDTAVHTATVLMGRISDRELAIRRQLLNEAVTTGYDEALGVHLAACDRELRRLDDRDASSGDAQLAGSAAQ
ncbi:enoyl-CoA-hydratase DpgB [Streptomyces sp. PR69]|uniref:enoyl-CoA-hydratase DpgB n=1 Tax=Streptomyces sp. PR69 TaxID=2984950 RepID=UPI00226545BD|nr:enoyl-CoA-hydratase DpgB [Streptomyces sp. PR69]